ncbi:sensor histidine kinase [Labilibacter marinus]|uniref:sensor histidine kinase n=1 Tax=Labilibacter marinus TaxID=1477105 RepID=UPI00094F77FA|nr:ATP-binding protein [Labilibacter marinus]
MSEQMKGCVVKKDFKYYIQKLVVFGKKERSMQDLILIYTFFSLIILVPLSLLVNLCISVSVKLIYFDIVAIVVFSLAYYLSNKLINLRFLRIFFIIAANILICISWLISEGSSGPTIVLYVALFSIIIFISEGREFLFFTATTAMGITAMYVIEYLYPEILLPYGTPKDKIIYSISVVTLILSFEIPLLIYARSILYRERDEAIENAENKAYLLANMSHEIRTPMNAILGFTELLSDPQIEKDESKSYLEIVNQNSRILMNLLNNVINVSKLNSDKIQAYYSIGNANNILKHTYETLNTFKINSGIEFRYEQISEHKAEFEVDENLLFQILLNLGYNALKFTQKGSVVFSATRRDKYITFSVKDTGVGIPKKQQPCIFNSYEQADNNKVIRTANIGAGLGLSISKRITDLLDGEIWFNSKEGRGSQFFVRLPVDRRK